jgi:hypothetical protein
LGARISAGNSSLQISALEECSAASRSIFLAIFPTSESFCSGLVPCPAVRLGSSSDPCWPGGLRVASGGGDTR